MLDGGDADPVAVEPGPGGALVHLRRPADGVYLSAGDRGGVVVWSREARGWESFLPLPAGTPDTMRQLRGRTLLRAGSSEPIERGGVVLGPGFTLALGTLTLPISEGLSIIALGDPSAPRFLLLFGGRAPPILLSRYEPVVLWRHDGSDAADEEIGAGIASLRSCGGYGGPVRVLAGSGRAATGPIVSPDGEQVEPVAPDDPDALPDGAGPFLLLLNGVFCGGPIAPVLEAIAFGPGPLSPSWRRIGRDPFGTDGAMRATGAPENRAALALDPAVIGSDGSARDRRLLDAVLGAAGGTVAADGALAERLRFTALAAGTPIDATILDRFVATCRPDRDGHPVATLVNARELPVARRVSLGRELADVRPEPPS